MIDVLATGPLATVQDLGRPGYAALGVPRSGAFDQAALRLANRLVGNPETAAGVEITAGGFALHCRRPVTIALTGALCPGAPEWCAPVTLPAGARFRLGAPRRGVRTYLAVRGGVGVTPVLGSRSTDLLGGVGPAPLRAGDVLPVGPVDGSQPLPAGQPAPVRPAEPALLRVRWGPRDDWFAAGARRLLLASAWTVRQDSDRIGLRLDGPALPRIREGELPSEPILPGAIQVPPDGRPILFGPDAPTTGGYPVVAVADDDGSRSAAAQAAPGDTVRFTE